MALLHLLSGSSNASPAHGILSGDFEARLSANDTRHDSTSAAAAAAAAAAVAPPDIPASTASHHSATPLSAHLNRGPTSLMDMSSGGDVVHAPTLSSPGRTPSHTPSAGGVVSSLNPNADPYHGPSTDFRDGRVRNPVPTKLQNQTSIKDGNFSVMHMDRASARSAVDERDMAAKRSSEATQAAAMDAYSKGYQPLKRGRQTWRPSSPADQQQQPPHPNVSYDATSRAMPSPNHPYMMPPSASSSSSTYRMPGMQPSEVKAEQARLLTFLRSLHPMMVVDQLCKAVAYFGGIPGAPPLADTGTFPTSERGNGNGALIISWLAEIFPPTDPSQPPPMPYSGSSVSVLGDVEGKDASQADAATGQSGDADGETPVRRARGRPKGSKSTKTRRDKGMKKGQRLGPEYQDDLLAQDPYQTQDPSSATDAQGNPGVRKRGRPKGSKNRPKPPPSDNAPQDHEGDSSLSNSGPNGIKPHFGMPQQQQPQQPGYYGPQQPPQQRPGQFGNQPPPGAAFGGNAGGNGLMNMPYAMTSNHAAAAALHQQQQHHHPGTSGSGTGPGGPGPGPGSASSPSYGAQPPPHLQAAAMGGDRPMQDSMYDVFNNRR
ncbi:hypothetical protein GMORB2_6011 [Geosmithia morbida]|uniref:Uncharacterized protein n=1 Tax=Geosmithia morbida TaxID=1094350 RepID=A0A9P4YWH2_9HYPO|nr:uncharacterized protein GMORB2_6011 [Geosmithia morbida]KAF4123310.1 hypothetical protein GMORB2_6011 [Geosmithia morbida]